MSTKIPQPAPNRDSSSRIDPNYAKPPASPAPPPLVTCKCGHAYPYQAEFLGPAGSRERAGLLKALQGLPCPDCIRAAVEDTRALRGNQ